MPSNSRGAFLRLLQLLGFSTIGEARRMAKQPAKETAQEQKASASDHQRVYWIWHGPSLRSSREFWQIQKVRYRERVATTALAQPSPAAPCAVNFWTFAIPVILASAVSSGVGLLAKRYFNGEHAQTQEAALLATKFGAFWFVAGFGWIALCKRNGAKT